ncbi:MAG: hypothetical protein ABW036_06650, partial [Flavitalea sp.]
LKHKPGADAVKMGWGDLDLAFPGKTFPKAAIHEFITDGSESCAATNGFVAGMISVLMKNNGTTFWISSNRSLFPPALKQFGIDPERIIFIDLHKPKEVLWVMEEALKCQGLSAVVGELPELNFTNSRRLQLAVEQSRVTGFALRHPNTKINTTASLTRWKIEHLPSLNEDGLPGIGFPQWQVDLLKVRNGKPGSWQLSWSAGRFRNRQAGVRKLEKIFKQNVG